MSFVFPLLNAQTLVFSRIVNILEPDELVIISLCSRRTKALIKTYRKKYTDVILVMEKRITPTVGIRTQDKYYEVLCILEESNNKETFEQVEIGGFDVPVAMNDEGYLGTYWNDEIFGLKQITEHVCDIFNTDVGELVFRKESIWMVDWVNNRQTKPLKTFYVGHRSILSESEMVHILKNCNVTDFLRLVAPVPDTFQFSGKLPNVNSFQIQYSFWVTIDHLLATNCVEGCLFDSNLTISDIVRLFEHWLNGGFSRLKFFTVDLENVSRRDLFTYIENNAIKVEKFRAYMSPSGIQWMFYESYDLRRKDGVKASIRYRSWSKTLIIGVWPDAIGYCGN